MLTFANLRLTIVLSSSADWRDYRESTAEEVAAQVTRLPPPSCCCHCSDSVTTSL